MARCGARSLRRLGVLDVRCLRLAPGHNVDLLATRGHGAYDGKWLKAEIEVRPERRRSELVPGDQSKRGHWSEGSEGARRTTSGRQALRPEMIDILRS
jgi:hypothetical protein